MGMRDLASPRQMTIPGDICAVFLTPADRTQIFIHFARLFRAFKTRGTNCILFIFSHYFMPSVSRIGIFGTCAEHAMSRSRLKYGIKYGQNISVIFVCPKFKVRNPWVKDMSMKLGEPRTRPQRE